ncbi:MAG TPA: tyrosine-type recombinase/integrase, partial [Candidatus Cybelea sp.]
MKGFLRKRGDVWYTTFDLPRLPNQPRRQKCVRLGRISKAEAQERERQVLRRYDEGSFAEESSKTVGDLLDAWLTDLRPTAKSQTISPTTYQRYASIVKLHLKPHLGAVSLRRLSASDITTAYGKVRAKGLSGQSCLHTHRVLHTALEYGTKTLGWLRANPAAAVRSPRVTRKTAALDGNTVPILLEATRGTRFEYAVALTATTGLRRGELLALRWSKSVDFERRRLIVAESLEETKIFGLRFKAPKSGKIRVLPLADVAVPLLRLHRTRQDAERRRRGSRYNDN